MLEKYKLFGMFCFHVTQARFIVSAQNFMNVRFFAYDVVRSYEHYREQAAACEFIHQFLQPADYMFECGVVTIGCGTILGGQRQRFNHGLERHTDPP
jgi:hypothetical protein